MSLETLNENKYNGWTNYATWKIMLELFDGVEFYNPLDAAEVKHIVDEYLLDGLMIDTPLISSFNAYPCGAISLHWVVPIHMVWSNLALQGIFFSGFDGMWR